MPGEKWMRNVAGPGASLRKPWIPPRGTYSKKPGSSERPAVDPDHARLTEFRTESRALPSFYVWTLGCQMNRSDSEEMAGRLHAAGCAEAPGMDAADLIVINTCAIREAAEAKVIGRQGELAKLKRANPSMRVVMTGC